MKLRVHRHEDLVAATGNKGESIHTPRVEFDMPWDDETLVAGLKKGDSHAVQYAVEYYSPGLYRFATYQLGDPSAAEDIVSEVVTRMLEKIGQYKHTGAPFQAWLYSIARNLMRDNFRRKKNSSVVSLDAAINSEEIQRLGGPDAQIDNFGDRDELVRIMAHLTDEQRQIVTLRIVEGWQPQEIAELLGRSIDSVKSLQYRALQTMKRHMGLRE